LSRRHLRRRGVVLVWVAIVFFVMLLFVGLLVDTGKLALNLHQLQNAADAAALAGALVVKSESPEVTRQKTYDLGFANAAEHLAVTLRMTPQPEPFSGDEAAYDILIGRWVRYNNTFVPTLDAPNAVRAFPRRVDPNDDRIRPLALVFGPIVGVDTADAARQAVAFCNSSGGAGLIVLSPLPNQGLEIGATADIDIDGGGIHVNSTAIGKNNQDGAWIHGTPMIDAGFLNVVGGVSPAPEESAWEGIFEEAQLDGEAGGFAVMDYMDGIQHIDDPLAAQMLDEPLVAATGTHLDLPTILNSQGGPVPTWHARWNDSTSSYELFDPTDPSVYMRWNDLTSGYDSVPTGAGFDPTLFHDTVGLGSEIVTDPNTGLPILDASTGLPTYRTTNPAVNVELPPGYYPYGMRLTNGDDVTLAPSAQSGSETFFILGGGTGGTDVGLYMSGGNLTGNGVTCYVTQNFDTGVPGVLRITGGSLDLDSPGDWQNQNSSTIDMSLVDGLNGIAVWQDPTMPDLPDAHLNGNGDFFISGTIYCPDPVHMRLEGDLGDTGNQVLCGTANILGTAEMNVNYDGRNYGNTTARSCLVW
jgi:hypothetical protein